MNTPPTSPSKALAKFDRFIWGVKAVLAGVAGIGLIVMGISACVDLHFFGVPMTMLGVAACVYTVRWILSFFP